MGLKFAMPIQNNAAKGNLSVARANLRSSELNLRDLELSITLAVRTAVRNIDATEKGVKAAEKTRYLQRKSSKQSKGEGCPRTELGAIRAQFAFFRKIARDGSRRSTLVCHRLRRRLSRALPAPFRRIRAGRKRADSGLRLPANARVLDLCCGAGRHSRALLRSSPTPLKVLALDLSADLLHRAAAASPGDVRVGYIRGDMRVLPLQPSSLDGAMNIFTSFGYFDTDDEHQRVLDGVARALKPGGRFFMDFFNPAPVIAQLPVRTEKRVDGVTIVEERTYDADRKRICKRIEESGPDTHRLLHESVRGLSFG